MPDFERFPRILTTIGLFWFLTPSFAAEGQLAPTPETGAIPGHRPDAPVTVNLWQPGDAGQPLHIHGWVRSTNGKPIVGAIVNVRQADGTGRYHDDRYRASLRTGKDGSYRFSTVLPGQYYRAKHIHVVVTHQDHERVVTRILFKRDPNLDETVVDFAIHLEEARVKGRTLLFGRFDVVMRPTGSS